MQTKNVGACDRTMRIVAGIVLAGLAYYKLDGTWQIAASILAVVMLLTGIVRYCPLYPVFGVDSTKCTCKMCCSGKCKDDSHKTEEGQK